MRFPTIQYTDRYLLGLFPVRHARVNFRSDTQGWSFPSIGALANRISTDARILYDIVAQPQARRPFGKFLNVMLGTRIKHNSPADIFLHAVYVTTVVGFIAALVGAALGSSPAVVCGAMIGCVLAVHCCETDGLLQYLFI